MLRSKPDITEEGNIEGHVYEMTIDPESMPEVMMLLTDLYPDPEAAVIRELGTNAWDAHVEAGQSRPIEIEKPTTLAPNFIVRDFGTGMDLNDIERVYTKYGASTRRNSNEFTGTLGMGSKSPMAYCGQLTIKTTKDGWTIVAIMSRREDNTAGVEIVSHEQTDLPNGTEITVPRMERGDFDQKVDHFYSYWEPHQVLIDDRPPKTVQGERLGTSIILRSGKQGGYRSEKLPDMLVMGGVPYRVDPKYSLFDPQGLPYDYSVSVVCYVKMGSIAFAPSREELIYTSQTKTTLDNLRKEIAGRIKWLMEKQIAEAKTHYEAVKCFSKWKHEHGFVLPNVRYRGEEIPVKWNLLNKAVRFTGDRTRYSHRANYSPVSDSKDFPFFQGYLRDPGEHYVGPMRYDTLPNSTAKVPMIVLGVPFNEKKDMYSKDGIRRELTQAAKLKIRLWTRLNNLAECLVLLEHPDPKWLSGLETISWDVVKTVKPPRGPANPEYTFEDHKGGKVTSSELPANGEGVLYCEPHQIQTYAHRLHRLNTVKNKTYILVQVQERRLPKFLRHFPRALPIRTVYELEVRRYERELKTKTDLARLMMDPVEVEFFCQLKDLVILDPVVQDMIKIATIKPTPETKKLWNEYDDFARSWHRRDTFPAREYRRELKERYPLLTLAHLPEPQLKIFMEHQARYMNWWYLTELALALLNPAPTKEVT